MVDTTDSPSSLLGDGEYTTDEDVWSPSLRRDIFSHDNTTTRRSPSPRQNISPPYLNHLDTGASTEQQPRTQQQPLYHLSPPPSLTQVLNTFSSSQLSSQPSGASQDLPQSTLDAQSENHSSAASVESEPSSRSISPISWNVLSSDSEPGTHRINDPDLRQESVVASSNPHPNTSQQTSSDFVDLTGEADTLLRARMSCASPQRGPNKRRRVGSNASASSPRGNQRRKTQSQNAVPPAVEEVDLRDVDDDKGLSKVLEDQRMATIKAQQEQASRPVKLATLSCVICMDQMTDVTATYCGHLFCHKCLMEALIAGENQGSEPGKGPSKCPVCRKRIKRPGNSKRDTGQVVALEIKVGMRNDKGKGRERTRSLKNQRRPSMRKDPTVQDDWD